MGRYSTNFTEYDLAEDLRQSPYIKEKCRDDNYAQHLYAALCNNIFQKTELIEILKDKVWYCSWRASGRLVSEIQEAGSYIDWYCSGISQIDGFISEGIITDEIRNDLKLLGWSPVKEI